MGSLVALLRRLAGVGRCSATGSGRERTALPSVVVWSICSVAVLAPSVRGQAGPSDRERQLFADGAAKLKQGDFQAAIASYKSFLVTEPNFGPAYLNLGLAYSSLKDYANAVPAYEHALALDPTLEAAALFLGIAYCKQGRPELAKKPLERALELDPNEADAHLWLGRALLANGEYREAAGHLERAREAHPADMRLAYNLSQAYLQLSEQIADDIYQRDPNSAWAHFLRAQAYWVEGNANLAAIEAKTVVKLSPSFEGAHELLADVDTAQKDNAGAEHELSEELRINPHNYGAVCKIADVYLHDGNANRALSMLQRTEHATSLACIEYSLGRALMQKGDYAAAVERLKQAVVRDEQFAPAYMFLGQSYAKLGRNEDAREAVEKGKAILQTQLARVRRKLGTASPQ